MMFYCSLCGLSLGVFVCIPVGGFQVLDAVNLLFREKDTPPNPLPLDMPQLLVPPDGRDAHAPFLGQLPDSVILRCLLCCLRLSVFLKRTSHACADELLKFIARYQYHFHIFCHKSLILKLWRQSYMVNEMGELVGICEINGHKKSRQTSDV